MKSRTIHINWCQNGVNTDLKITLFHVLECVDLSEGKVNQSHYRPEIPRVFQEVKFP